MVRQPEIQTHARCGRGQAGSAVGGSLARRLRLVAVQLQPDGFPLSKASPAVVERGELTAGSSWHAAGGFHAINSDPVIARLQAYTIGMYRTVEQESGQSAGLHLTGGIELAGTPERAEWLKAELAWHRLREANEPLTLVFRVWTSELGRASCRERVSSPV